jgi:hypothetical protein
MTRQPEFPARHCHWYAINLSLIFEKASLEQ